MSETSEWYVILALTNAGQRIAIAQDMDGPVMSKESSREEAIEQAKKLSHLIGIDLYDSTLDDD